MPLSILLPALLAAPAHAGEESILPESQPYLLLHLWATAYDADRDVTADPAGYGDPEDDLGFKVRRARVGLTGRGEQLRYDLVVGASAPFDALTPSTEDQVELVDASAGWSPAEGLWVTGGVQKVPISREQLMSSQRLTLAERTVAAEWLVPGRDTGLLAEYRTGSQTMQGRLSAGVYNGNGSIDTDDGAGKLVAARAELIIGEANPYRTFGVVDGLTFAIAGDFFRNDDVATDTMGYGADLMLRAGGLAITAEGRLSSLSPDSTDVSAPGVLSDTRRMGGLVQVGYTIKRLEPAARFSIFDDDMDVEDSGDVGEVLAGMTWNGPSAKVRVGGGYVYRMELGGVDASNNTVRLWWMMKL